MSNIVFEEMIHLFDRRFEIEFKAREESTL